MTAPDCNGFYGPGLGHNLCMSHSGCGKRGCPHTAEAIHVRCGCPRDVSLIPGTDAPTVRPGGIMLGTPIPSEPPDPSQIIGVCIMGAPPTPEYPPIPPAGFYWAKCSDDTPDEWTVVKVFEEPEGGRWVENTVGGSGSYVHEWGPALYPPGNGVAQDETAGKCTGCAVPLHRGNSVNRVGDKPWHTQRLVRSLTGTVEALQRRYDERKAQRLTYAEAQKLKGALGAALLPAPFGGEPEVSRQLTGAEHAELEAAIARVTVQPTECTHEAWEWPMARCPTCGTEGR